MNDWLNSLERDIEVTEGQLVLARLLPAGTSAFVHVEAERLSRLVEAAKTALAENGDSTISDCEPDSGGEQTTLTTTPATMDHIARTYLNDDIACSRCGLFLTRDAVSCRHCGRILKPEE